MAKGKPKGKGKGKGKPKKPQTMNTPPTVQAAMPGDPPGLDAFMAAIRTKESGGNYRATGATTKYGRATGAYQFLDSTWGGYGGYKSAKDAPPEVQDRRAREKMKLYYLTFGNWADVARSWYAGPGFRNKDLNKRQSAGGMKNAFPSINDYANSVMKLMGMPASTSQRYTTGRPGSTGAAEPYRSYPTAPTSASTGVGMESADNSAAVIELATSQGINPAAVSGMSIMDAVKALRDLSIQSYPGLKNQIEQGMTIEQISEPYRQVTAQRLGISQADFDLMQPKWKRALNDQRPDGSFGPIPLWEWERLVMTDQSYGYNNAPEAKEKATQLKSMLEQTFGARG